MKTIGEGAEGRIIAIDENILLKIRDSKPYRIKEIDEKLRKFRCKREFKVLTKLYEKNTNVPKPISLNEKEKSFEMEYIKGNILKEILNEELLIKSFEEIIKMHNLDIVHGDLTTLNMIEKNGEIYIIDFGLAEFTKKIEEKAVDLNLFFTCIKNEHKELFWMKSKLCEKYYKIENGEKVIQRLKEIEQRGRNK